jgi:hypothetical protein
MQSSVCRTLESFRHVNIGYMNQHLGCRKDHIRYFATLCSERRVDSDDRFWTKRISVVTGSK